MQNNEKQRNVINTKYGELLFVEADRNDDGSSRKECYAYTLDGKYLTLIKAYWWDKNGIIEELSTERVEDIITDKMFSNKQTVIDKMTSTLELIRRLDNDKLTEEAEALLEHIKAVRKH